MTNIQYQTSPYLHFQAGKRDKIYDILADENIQIQPIDLEILKFARIPQSFEDIISKSSKLTFEFLIQNNLLLECNEIWNKFAFRAADIEINSYCNWKCDYCPSKMHPKSAKTMSMDLFNEIIEKISAYKRIKNVTFNSYNEPTLDKYFIERVEKVKKEGLHLVLFTNGSHLDKSLSCYLSQSGIVEAVFFNLPSIDRKRFYELTGYSNYDQIITNIKDAIDAKLNVQLSIQGTQEEAEENLNGIRNMFQSILKDPIQMWETKDRAGLLKNRYYDNVHINEPTLYGCMGPITHLNVSVEGDCFICSNDYYQNNVIGNIKDGQIQDLFENPNAIDLRKKIFGGIIAENDFICRKCKAMEKEKLIFRLSRLIRPIFD